MTSWAALDDELNRWRDMGRAAGLWWRDDDAICATASLDRLLALNRRWAVPLSLCVIPGLADKSLAAAVDGRPDVAVLQHGFRHINHAGAGEKKSELGAHRPIGRVMDELDQGRGLMESLFGGNGLPVLAPPWNRINDAVVASLPGVGFAGISGFRARNNRRAAPGLIRVNTHVDIIDWPGVRGYRGDRRVLGDLCCHLAARRSGAVDATEPTGLLTHHLDHDEACWEFIETLLERTTQGAEGLWQSGDEIFARPAGLQ